MRSPTFTADGSAPSATTLTRSRSVTIPVTRSPSVMMTEEIPLSFRIRAASVNEASGPTVFTSLVMMSPTCIATLQRLGGRGLAYRDAA